MDLRLTKRIFLTTKQAQGVTGRRLETYTTDLTRFFEFVVSKEIFSVTEIAADIIREFLSELKGKMLRLPHRVQELLMLNVQDLPGMLSNKPGRSWFKRAPPESPA